MDGDVKLHVRNPKEPGIPGTSVLVFKREVTKMNLDRAFETGKKGISFYDGPANWIAFPSRDIDFNTAWAGIIVVLNI